METEPVTHCEYLHPIPTLSLSVTWNNDMVWQQSLSTIDIDVQLLHHSLIYLHLWQREEWV